MKYLNKFNENNKSINNVLLYLHPYLDKKGVHTRNLVELSLSDNYLYVELDIPSAFPGEKSERDRIKNFLRRNGFEYYSIGCSVKSITNDDKEIIKKYLK
jgi:uncharacterized metal-binding protein